MLAVMFLTANSATYAQKADRQRLTREQLADKQARHIAADIALNDADSKRFVETYCRCQKEIWALGPRKPRPAKGDNNALTDKQAEQNIKDRFAKSQKILDIRQKYYAEYSKFLTPKQIERVYQIERQMMNRLAKHGKEGPRGPHKPRRK